MTAELAEVARVASGGIKRVWRVSTWNIEVPHSTQLDA